MIRAATEPTEPSRDSPGAGTGAWDGPHDALGMPELSKLLEALADRRTAERETAAHRRTAG